MEYTITEKLICYYERDCLENWKFYERICFVCIKNQGLISKQVYV